jgi:hypothetical protein
VTLRVRARVRERKRKRERQRGGERREDIGEGDRNGVRVRVEMRF